MQPNKHIDSFQSLKVFDSFVSPSCMVEFSCSFCWLACLYSLVYFAFWFFVFFVPDVNILFMAALLFLGQSANLRLDQVLVFDELGWDGAT